MYDLFITSANGERTWKSRRSPYPERKDAQRTVYTIIADSLAEEPTDADTEFVCRVTVAPLGETVTHGSGVAFRTEVAA